MEGKTACGNCDYRAYGFSTDVNCLCLAYPTKTFDPNQGDVIGYPYCREMNHGDCRRFTPRRFNLARSMRSLDVKSYVPLNAYEVKQSEGKDG